MPSPQIVQFTLIDPSTFAPVTGAVPTFVTYKDETGTNLSQPTIHEVGGGAYYFTPVFTLDHTIHYLINPNASSQPVRVAGMVRPEDFAQEGQWRIFNTGGNTNQLWYYAADNTTVLAKYDLFDFDGNPASVGVAQRVPL
jgi:hypothetical protein